MLILMGQFAVHHHRDCRVERALAAERRMQAMDADSSPATATMTTTMATSFASTSDAVTASTTAASASASSLSTAAMTTAPPRRPGGGQCRSDMPGVDDPVELLQNRGVVAANMICPFLGALMRAGELPGCILHRSQLLDITVRAGLPTDRAMAHIDGNFRNIPGGFIDVCCMEGATSEHVTSTGINDC
eukprot:CAMPEP_0178401022 /NCGR_PEP_ID=MMETSP0689_2-20121128/16087_1 /TAXON_ID=160604 /ORGANISM="Amphidinium massartii, Strain CS-259" /LENGTH=188 /DNA_ID=CAMNT_0020021829 /DNA_START=133 /DNA_END=696 /DNA_ORIENTATION=+